MKKLKFSAYLFFIILLTAGCVAALPVMYAAQVGMGALSVLGAVDAVHTEITRSDYNATVDSSIDQVMMAAKKAFDEMDITHNKSEKNEKGDAAAMHGETLSKMEIKVAAAKITETTCRFGIWAKERGLRNPAFAQLLAVKITKYLSQAGPPKKVIRATEKKKRKSRRK